MGPGGTTHLWPKVSVGNTWLVLRGRLVKEKLAVRRKDGDAALKWWSAPTVTSVLKELLSDSNGNLIAASSCAPRTVSEAIGNAFAKSDSEVVFAVCNDATRVDLMSALAATYSMSHCVCVKASIARVENIAKHWNHCNLVDALATAFALQPSFVECDTLTECGSGTQSCHILVYCDVLPLKLFQVNQWGLHVNCPSARQLTWKQRVEVASATLQSKTHKPVSSDSISELLTMAAAFTATEKDTAVQSDESVHKKASSEEPADGGQTHSCSSTPETICRRPGAKQRRAAPPSADKMSRRKAEEKTVRRRDSSKSSEGRRHSRSRSRRRRATAQPTPICAPKAALRKISAQTDDTQMEQLSEERSDTSAPAIMAISGVNVVDSEKVGALIKELKQCSISVSKVAEIWSDVIEYFAVNRRSFVIHLGYFWQLFEALFEGYSVLLPMLELRKLPLRFWTEMASTAAGLQTLSRILSVHVCHGRSGAVFHDWFVSELIIPHLDSILRSELPALLECVFENISMSALEKLANLIDDSERKQGVDTLTSRLVPIIQKRVARCKGPDLDRVVSRMLDISTLPATADSKVSFFGTLEAADCKSQECVAYRRPPPKKARTQPKLSHKRVRRRGLPEPKLHRDAISDRKVMERCVAMYNLVINTDSKGALAQQLDGIAAMPLAERSTVLLGIARSLPESVGRLLPVREELLGYLGSGLAAHRWVAASFIDALFDAMQLFLEVPSGALRVLKVEGTPSKSGNHRSFQHPSVFDTSAAERSKIIESQLKHLSADETVIIVGTNTGAQFCGAGNLLGSGDKDCAALAQFDKESKRFYHTFAVCSSRIGSFHFGDFDKDTKQSYRCGIRQFLEHTVADLRRKDRAAAAAVLQSWLRREQFVVLPPNIDPTMPRSKMERMKTRMSQEHNSWLGAWFAFVFATMDFCRSQESHLLRSLQQSVAQITIHLYHDIIPSRVLYYVMDSLKNHLDSSSRN